MKRTAATDGDFPRHSAYAVSLVFVLYAALALYLNIRIQGGVSDDHSGYLSMARQIQLGEIPIRDFLDLGTFLHLWLSAAVAQAGSGFLPELVLSWTFIIAGQLIAMYLVWRATGCLWVACIGGIIALLTFPRPYSFPKVFVYPATVWLLWRYIDQPDDRQARLLGVWAAAALLLRFDHGVAVMLSAIAVVVPTHVTRSAASAMRATANVGAAFVVALVPFLIFLATSVGIVSHLETMLEFGRIGLGEGERIRWQAFWGNPFLSGRLGTAFLYDLVALLTVGTTLWLGVRSARELRTGDAFSPSTLRLWAVLALWFTAAPMLVRNNFEARIPDASSLLLVLGGIAAVPWRLGGWRPPTGVRAAYSVIAMLVAGLSLVAALRFDGSGFLTMQRAAEMFAADGIERAQETIAGLQIEPPFRRYEVTDVRAEHGLDLYIHECTRPSDRLLVTFFRPQLYVDTERGFAGGQWRYFQYHNSPANQEETLDKLSRQRVPIAVTRRSDEESFRRLWTQLAAHIDTNYRRLEGYSIGDADIEVWVDRRLTPTGFIGGNLPCFR